MEQHHAMRETRDEIQLVAYDEDRLATARERVEQLERRRSCAMSRYVVGSSSTSARAS